MSTASPATLHSIDMTCEHKVRVVHVLRAVPFSKITGKPNCGSRSSSCLRHTYSSHLHKEILSSAPHTQSTQPARRSPVVRCLHAKLSFSLADRVFLFSTFSFPRAAAGSALDFWSATTVRTATRPTAPAYLTRRTYASKRKMPPKKEVKQEKILLGRPGNNLKSGIVCTAKMCVSYA